ncbi:hypothetical protein EZS27_013559, partial [termite gut metagenome]
NVLGLAQKDDEGKYSFSDGLLKDIWAEIAALKGVAPGEGGEYDYAVIAEALVGIDDFIDAIIAKIDESNPGLVTLGAQVNGLITSISLVGDLSSGVTFNAVASKTSITFGEAGKLVFEKGKILKEAVIKDILVQVSPANAVLDPAKIFLINSKGDDAINDFITIESAVPYEDLLTRAGKSTGIYKVTLALDPETYNSAALKAVIYKDPSKKNPETVGGNKILFALTVEDKISDDDRSVSTGFDLAFVDKSDATFAYNSLDFKVNNGSSSTPTSVANIKNRYTAGSSGVEKVWVNPSATADHSNPTSTSLTQNATTNDARSVKPGLSIEIGKTFKVALDGDVKQKAFAYYVGLDSQNATTAETTLWANADIENLSTVYATDQEAEITVTDANLVGKEIGLRVYAINADGTLVDPDGRAFYVICNGESVQGRELVFGFDINFNVSSGKLSTRALPISLEGINTSNIAETILDYSDTELKTALSNAQPILSNDYTTVTLPDVLLSQLKDNEVVDLGTLRIVNNVGATIISYDVKVKKDLPTRAPTGLKLKTTTGVPTANWSYNPGTKILKIMPTGITNPFDAAATTPPVGIKYDFATSVIGTFAVNAPVGTSPLTTNLFDVPRSSSNNTLSAIKSADISISVPDLGSNLKGNALSLNGQYSSTKQYLASAQYNYGDIAYNDGKAGKAHVALSTEAFILQIGSILETDEVKGYFNQTIASIIFIGGTTDGGPTQYTIIPSTSGLSVNNFRKYIGLNSISGELVGYSDDNATVAIPGLSTRVTVSGLKNSTDTDALAQLILTATNTVKDFSADNVKAIRLVLTFEDILGAELTKAVTVTSVNEIVASISATNDISSVPNAFAFTLGEIIVKATTDVINLPNLIAYGFNAAPTDNHVYTLDDVTGTFTRGGSLSVPNPADAVTYIPPTAIGGSDGKVTVKGAYTPTANDKFALKIKFHNAAGDAYTATLTITVAGL